MFNIEAIFAQAAREVVEDSLSRSERIQLRLERIHYILRVLTNASMDNSRKKLTREDFDSESSVEGLLNIFLIA